MCCAHRVHISEPPKRTDAEEEPPEKTRLAASSREVGSRRGLGLWRCPRCLQNPARCERLDASGALDKLFHSILDILSDKQSSGRRCDSWSTWLGV